MNVKLIKTIGSKVVAFGYRTHVIQNAPKILCGAGFGAIAGGVIFSCKGTLKAQEIIALHKAKREEIQDAIDLAAMDETIEYSSHEKNKDIATLYFNTGKSLAKVYAVGSAFLIAGTLSILKGFDILNTRYVSAVADLSAVSMAYRKYRQRVREEFGEDVDKAIAQGIYKSELILEDGKKKEKITEYDIDFNEAASPYMMVFNEETSTAYIKPSKYYGASARANRLATTEANMSYLIHQQSVLTSRLQRDGFLFLNDALDTIGFTKLGKGKYKGVDFDYTNKGWVYPTDAEGNYIGNGDGYVDFGIFNFGAGLKGSEDWTIVDRMKDDSDVRNPWVVNYKTGDIVLDFNVDGDISGCLPPPKLFRTRKTTSRIKE